MASEAITVNRTLGITLSIIGGIGTAAIVAGVGVLWGQSQSIARMEAREESRAKQLDSLEETVKTSTANRYTASDAAQDRTAFFKALSTAYETSGRQIDTLTRAKDDQGTVIADLRVKVAMLEGKGKP